MKLIHTSDWQIGKVFRMFDPSIESILQAERLEAISRLGRIAVENDAKVVLVAGDVWDNPHPSELSVGQAIERMRAVSKVEWHLIPGNHDFHQEGGFWDRTVSRGLPPNVRLHIEPKAAPVGDGEEAWILPAPLTRRHAIGDPTEAMEAMETPPGRLRIGVAHGSIREFGSDESSTRNRIATDRAARAKLDYLALGDWHGLMRIDEKTWYSGTPEVDRFETDAIGQALLVDLGSPGSSPKVQALETGRFRWIRERSTIHGEDDVRGLEARLRQLDGNLSRIVADLEIAGTLSLAGRSDFERSIRTGVGAAFFALLVDDSNLSVEPTTEDLDGIDLAGFVRVAADRLKADAADPNNPRRAAAALALRELWTLQSRGGEA